jgi:mevalonate kinase
MPSISCSAPGKVILCGEHAVIYGSAAIALPVFQVSTVTRIFAKPVSPSGEVHIISPQISMDTSLSSIPIQNPLRATIEFVMQELKIDHIPACEIRIQSTLPLAAGMGSSASVTVSLVRALSTFLGHPFENKIINQIAFEVEKLYHGSPSGIDNSVITFETPLLFQLESGIQTLKIARSFSLVIADTGIKSSTAAAVAGVRKRWEKNKNSFEIIFNEIDHLTKQIKDALEQGKLEVIGPALTRNHELLQHIGVSSKELDQLVVAAVDSGAFGAKLSGGGLGGNMIALVAEENALEIAHHLEEKGASRTIITSIPASARGKCE